MQEVLGPEVPEQEAAQKPSESQPEGPWHRDGGPKLATVCSWHLDMSQIKLQPVPSFGWANIWLLD